MVWIYHIRTVKENHIKPHHNGKGFCYTVHMDKRNINDIAHEIYSLWAEKINFAARPYLEAMLCVEKPEDSYYYEDGETQVRYFLSNASTWRGADARRIKAELKQIVGIK